MHYSVQGNHLHLMVEADDTESLSNGMQGFAISAAKRLNKLWGRKGPVFADRYHVEVLRSPTEVRNALGYVLNNHRRHNPSRRPFDRFSSSTWFDGWTEPPDPGVVARAGPSVVVPARSWLLSKGWRERGRISVDLVPGRRKS